MTEQQQRPVMLVILDGWGWSESNTENAVRLAHTPTFDRLWGRGPHAFLTTSGEDVGLPEGQFGNSEVGHLNIGAGRVVMQELPRITRAARDGSLATNAELAALIAAAKAGTGVVHLVGLVSPGGVHAHQDHAVVLATILADAGLSVLVHVITDGRDTPPRSAVGFVAAFEAALPPGARIATLSGRYHAMDRDNRWERVERAWDVMIEGDGPRFASAAEAIAEGYDDELGDEFLTPAIIGDYDGARDGDALLVFNFRADRIRQLLTAFLDPGFTGLSVCAV
jgi:2,3-bisphosphoglycerate-independent phosphoglycerate mutase